MDDKPKLFSLDHKIALERRSYGDTAEHEGNQCCGQAVCSPVDALLVDGQCTPNLGTRKAVVCGGDELTGKRRHVERRSNGGCGPESVHLMSTSDSPGDENGAPLVDPKGTVTGVSSISSTRSTNLTQQSVFSLAPRPASQVHLSEDRTGPSENPGRHFVHAREDKPLEGDISGLRHLVQRLQPSRQKWGRRDGAHLMVRSIQKTYHTFRSQWSRRQFFLCTRFSWEWRSPP